MKRRILSAMLLMVALGSSVFAQYHALFRFDASLPLGSPYHDQVSLHDVTVRDYLPSEEIPARGSAGWGLSRPQQVHFNSDTSSLISNDEAIVSFFGNHIISGELWLKPDSLNGTIFSWGDTLAPHFITMFLQDGLLNIHRYLADSLYTMASPVLLDTSSWSYLYWFNRVLNGTIEFELYLNGEAVYQQSDSLTAPAAFTLIRSQVKVGYSNDPRTTGRSFRGSLLGISLTNYLRAETYLHSSPPFDGSEFLGMPLYLERGSDKIITTSPTPVLRTAFMPYSNDYYIPQGMASTFEDKHHPVNDDMVYLAMYHKDVDGDIGGHNSIIVEMDPADAYRVRRCFQFTAGPVYGHLPAMAYYAGNIYVGSEGSIYRCEIPAYDSTAGKYFNLEPNHTQSLYSSNLDYFDDTLWVASWGAHTSSGRAFMFGYPISETGDINNQATPIRYEIPNTNQGAGWTEYGGEKYLFVCTSYGGSNNSLLYRYRKGRLQPATLVAPDRIFELPAGGEDFTFDDAGNLIITSESSSRTYQTRTYTSPWNQFFPFVFEISPDVLFDDVDTTTTGLGNPDQRQQPEKFVVSVYPNPFNATVKIVYTLAEAGTLSLNVYDIEGRLVETVLHNRLCSSGRHQLAWTPESDFSGVYLLNFTYDSRDSFSQKIMYLK